MPPLKYFVPNSFTALSLVLGLGSVVQSVRGDFDLAAWMILWGTLLDKADGSAARLFKATSAFGVQFDSFADFVAFGVAPAALFYFKLKSGAPLNGLTELGGLAELGLGAACAWYVVALAIRLARFNITTDASDTEFLGLPGTVMGAILASGFLTWSKYSLSPALLSYIPIVLALGGALMVSNVRLPKLKRRKSTLVNIFQYSCVAVGYTLGPLRLLPEVLFGLAMSYTLGGICVCIRRPQEDEPVTA